MKNAFIFHGVGGHPEENWFPWMKKELEQKGWSVTVPQFPDPSTPDYSIWRQQFDQFINICNEDTMLIGHSLGATFILRLLEEVDLRVGSAALVAGPIKPMGNDFDPLISTFLTDGFDWDVIKIKAKKFVAFYGDNDPYVPLSQGEELSEKLNAILHVVNDGGHLNQGSGYTEFPELITALS